MNRAQRFAWVGFVILFLLSVAYPPWRLGTAAGEQLKFACLFAPPDHVKGPTGLLALAESQKLSWGILLVEWLALAIGAGCLHFALRTPCARSAPPPGAPPSR